MALDELLIFNLKIGSLLYIPTNVTIFSTKIEKRYLDSYNTWTIKKIEKPIVALYLGEKTYYSFEYIKVFFSKEIFYIQKKYLGAFVYPINKMEDLSCL